MLLDVALGHGPDGYEVCRTLRERHNTVPIIMLTALDSEADTVLGLEAGADDYVGKPVGLAELRSRIRAVLRRAGPRTGELLEAGPLQLDRGARVVRRDGDPVELTFSEFEVLAALMAAPGPAAQPPGADAGDLGRLGLPRSARDRRARPPPAREARGGARSSLS